MKKQLPEMIEVYTCICGEQHHWIIGCGWIKCCKCLKKYEIKAIQHPNHFNANNYQQWLKNNNLP